MYTPYLKKIFLSYCSFLAPISEAALQQLLQLKTYLLGAFRGPCFIHVSGQNLILTILDRSYV